MMLSNELGKLESFKNCSEKLDCRDVNLIWSFFSSRNIISTDQLQRLQMPSKKRMGMLSFNPFTLLFLLAFNDLRVSSNLMMNIY